MDVANQTEGANVNVLMDHSRLCPLSYNMAFNGHPVAIRKLRTPQATASASAFASGEHRSTGDHRS
jgi:hypothetical protein